MKQVKMFSEYRHYDVLEESINEFCEEHAVIDIKYDTSFNDDRHNMYHSAMVIYTEIKDESLMSGCMAHTENKEE